MIHALSAGPLLPLLCGLALLQAALWGLARLCGRRLDRWAVAAGLALPLLLLLPWFATERLLVPSAILSELIPGAPPPDAGPDPYRDLNDTVLQLLPWELEVRHALHERRLPLWSDRLDGGSSPWINPQAGTLSPIAMLARLAPIQHHLLVSLGLKMLVALQGAWLLARAAGVRRFPALLSGAGYALGGGIMAWGLYPHSNAAAWAPWLVAATVLLVRRPSYAGVAGAALAAAALLLSGQPEVALGAGCLAVVAALWLRRPRTLVRGLVHAALAAVLGVALAAPLLVPFALAIPASQRGLERAAVTAPHASLDWRSPLGWFDEGGYQFFRGPLNPFAYGAPYRESFHGPIGWPVALASYAGLVALAGSALGLVHRCRRRAVPFLLAAGAGLLLAAKLLPLQGLLLRLPLVRIPEYTRLLPIAALGLAVAGGLGLDAWAGSRRWWLGAAALGAVAVLSLAVDARGQALALWAVLLAAALALKRSRRAGLLGLGCVLLVELVPWARGTLPREPSRLFYPRTPAIAAIDRELGRGGSWRAVGEAYSLYPAILPFFGFAEVRTHNPLASASYLAVLRTVFGYAPSPLHYASAFGNVEHPLLDFLGVRVVASNQYMPAKARLQRLDDGSFAPYRLYRNPTAMPRWFLPTGAEPVAPRDLPDWLQRMTDPRRVALLPAEARGWLPPRRAWLPDAVRARSALPGRLVLDVPPAGEKLLATSIPAAAGWEATAAGRPLRRLTLDGAFFGAVVPAGVAELELRYLPPGLPAGALAAAAAWVVVAGLLASAARRSRMSRRRPG